MQSARIVTHDDNINSNTNSSSNEENNIITTTTDKLIELSGNHIILRLKILIMSNL